MNNTRNRMSADLQQSYRDVKKAETSAEVSRLDLEVAREQLSVLWPRCRRAGFRCGRWKRPVWPENEKWIAFYDAQYVLEKARWSVLRLTGDLVPAIEGMP